MKNGLTCTVVFPGIIKNGGAKPNIIPEKSVMEYYVRAPTVSELEDLKTKIIACFESAAKGTGCTVSSIWSVIRMSDVPSVNAWLSRSC